MRCQAWVVPKKLKTRTKYIPKGDNYSRRQFLDATRFVVQPKPPGTELCGGELVAEVRATMIECCTPDLDVEIRCMKCGYTHHVIPNIMGLWHESEISNAVTNYIRLL